MTKKNVSHVSKFDRLYFNIWKHRMILNFEVRKLWSMVSGEESFLVALSVAHIVTCQNLTVI